MSQQEILPETEWLEQQPKKPIVSKVIFSTAAATILLVEPTYKPTWQLPGGVVEAGEDPADTACREVYEELGLVIDIANLQLAGTVFNGKRDVLLLIYEYDSIIDETAKLKLQPEEIKSHDFVTPEVAASRMPDYYRSFWSVYK